METLTNQEIFTKVRDHLLKQGRQSISASTLGCTYYGTDEMKCAVGCLIPAEHYTPAIEGSAVHCPYTTRATLMDVLSASGIDPASYMLLRRLQQIHDEEEGWTQPLKTLAADFNLEY